MSLHELFQEIFKACQSNDYSALTTEELHALIHKIEECQKLLYSEALFSKNEELDDLQTESLKYLFLDYYYGKALINIQDIDVRVENLNTGRRALLQYIDRCKDYKLLHDSELSKIDEKRSKPMNGDEKRMFKIEKFKREKAAKKRIQEINRFLTITKQDSDIDHEEEQRELYILTLQSYVRDALDELDMLEEELVMLQLRREVQASEAERLKEGKNSTPHPLATIPPPDDPNRPGLSVTKTYKVGDKLMMSRDTVKATVFGSSIAPPTMSLEEFADIERADAEARAKAQAEAPKGPRRYNQLVADGEEDDLDLADEAILQDRQWDDWKDNNPKGWGNKAGKRY